MPAFTIRGKCPHSEFFWSVFSSIWIQYGDFPCSFPYSVQMCEYKDQKNSEYGHFLHSVSKSVAPFPKLENDRKKKKGNHRSETFRFSVSGHNFLIS